MKTQQAHCAICGITFEEAGMPSGWTFHWGTANGTTAIAETCCAAHAETWQYKFDRGQSRN